MKNLTRWLVGILCGLYLLLQIAVYIPQVQEMLGAVTSSTLKEAYGWDVSIGRIRLGLWNRVIVDDICLKDRQDSTLLHASRLAAKIDIMPLAKGQISIANAQLFGTQVHIYQDSPEEKPNFQFIIDTFSSSDTTSSHLNLRIGSVLLRRVSVNWDRRWIPVKEHGKPDLSHLRIRDLAVTAHLKALTSDSINLSLKRLSFTEESGVSLKNLSFDLVAGQAGATLDNLCLQLPHSTFSIPYASAAWPHFPRKGQAESWLHDIAIQAKPSLLLVPSDLSAFAPWLRDADTPVNIQSMVLINKGCLNVPSLNISAGKSLDASIQVFIYDIIGSADYTIELKRLRTCHAMLRDIAIPASTPVQKASAFMARLDSIDVSGRLHFTRQNQDGRLRIVNRYGNIDIKASAREWNHFDAGISTDGLLLNRILSDNGTHDLGKVAFGIKAKGSMSGTGGRPEINAHASLPLLQWQGREYRGIDLMASLRGNTLETKAEMQDHGGEIQSQLTWKHDLTHHITGKISIAHIHAERLGLGNRYPDTRLSANAVINLNGSNIDNISGSVGIRDFLMQGGEGNIGPMSVSVSTEVDRQWNRTLHIASAPLNLNAGGRFRFSTLAATICNGLSQNLPTLIPYKRIQAKGDSLHFQLSLCDTTLIRRMALRDITIPQQATLEGRLYGQDSIFIRGDIPELRIGKETLRNGKIDIQGLPQATKADISMERLHKKGYVALALAADAHDDRLRLICSLDNKRLPRISGDLDITTTFARNPEGRHDIRSWIAPSDFIISDTIWRVHPCAVTWDGKVVDIHGFKVSQSDHRGIDISGRISASEADTLHLNLREINLEYILDLVNFKDVEFQGLATGRAYATKLLSSPTAYAGLTVDGFAFNGAPLGTLQAKADWGTTPHLLSLDADIDDPANGHHSTISGGFTLGSKEMPNGLDLRVNTRKFNLAFLNFFTKDIFDDFRGRGTGYCRIFGPFKAIDLEGDMMLDHADFSMPMLGTAYHLQEDSVHIRPGNISITALLGDKNAPRVAHPFASYAHSGRSNTAHTAVLRGSLTHNHFKDLAYDFHVNANKFLGYDFKDFGESSFYATCIVSGDINVSGVMGRLLVDINATPEEGTVFTYNVSTPEALTDADFITINSRDTVDQGLPEGNTGAKDNTAGQPPMATNTASDLYLDFDLPITPAAKIRLLMDRKSGDMIEINGNGRIRAKYYNKGRFNIYGTYRVQDGTYRLSLQDIIRKEFKFQPGGTIVFGGDAMKADLNLKALYSVNSVSLDDLTASSLGFSKTKVDCIMNLTGHPEQPAIAFDFDLPNATEDERQMVRSIVSTEEERNMQAIYLLGLGRFYNFEADGAEQSTAAMNSLVSSTLSSHLNNLITTAVGSNNWRVSTYLQTTEDGWRNMDVEGQLSGSLLNNRLLLTGNFGYREKYYTQRNFISDVSIEYLLTHNGMLSVKAYNQANDRYFVQTSLNTQGIGLQYRKDFNHFVDLFQWLQPKKKLEKKKE